MMGDHVDLSREEQISCIKHFRILRKRYTSGMGLYWEVSSGNVCLLPVYSLWILLLDRLERRVVFMERT